MRRAGVPSAIYSYLLINMCIRNWNHKGGLWPLQWSVWVKINEQLKSSQTITSPQTQWQYFHMTHSSGKERSGQKQCASRSSQGVNHKVKNWKQTKWQCSSSNTYAWYTSSRMKTNTERIGSLCSIGALMRGKQIMGEIKKRKKEKKKTNKRKKKKEKKIQLGIK